MIATNRLKGIIAENNLSQRKIASLLGITEKTFYTKMKKGVFNSNEIEQMISILKIQNPAEIFLVSGGTQGVPDQ